VAVGTFRGFGIFDILFLDIACALVTSPPVCTPQTEAGRASAATATAAHADK
jgi:hypothetical protein